MRAQSRARAVSMFAGALMTAGWPIGAAAGTYLTLDGMAGSSAAQEDRIDLDSFSMNVTDTQAAPGAAGGHRGLNEVVIVKRADSVSRVLRTAAGSQQVFPHAVIEVTDAGGEALYRYEFYDVIIADMNPTKHDQPMEQFTLRFSREATERLPRRGPMRAGEAPTGAATPR